MRGDGATCDFAEGGEDEAKVFGNEVAGEIGRETLFNSLETGEGVAKCFVMTGIGDDGVTIVKSGDVGGLVNGLFQLLDVCAVLGGKLDELIVDS